MVLSYTIFCTESSENIVKGYRKEAVYFGISCIVNKSEILRKTLPLELNSLETYAHSLQHPLEINHNYLIG